MNCIALIPARHGSKRVPGKNVRMLSGHPLLVPAARDSVKEWVYQTTLLNGLPVEVLTQVDVNFTLSQ